MKSRADLLLFYTEYLGFAKFEQLSILFQTSIDIEEYLSKHDSNKVNLIKLMLLKHYLMEEAVGENLLTKDQAEHLMQQKAWEVKKHNPPFSFLSIDVELIPPIFLKELLKDLHQNKKFTFEEFKPLVDGYLSLPENYLKAVKELYEVPKAQPKVSISEVEDEGEILFKYEINCVCGNFLIFEVEKNSKMRMYCNQCKLLVVDLKKKKKSEVQTGKTLDDIAPDLVRKVNLETRKFDNYKLLRKLGEGASGKVYLAKDIESGEQVALKILTQADRNQHLDYFNREIKILSKLKHPNIVGLKNWGNFEEKPYLAMEYVAGETLLQAINKNGVIPPRHAAKIFIAILEALEYAKQQNFIHRDIKPANIIISEKGVKLIDLGLAKVLETSLGLTKTGQIMGTPYYIAPEQVSNFKGTDHRADIYSLGASLFHSLCGEPPFAEHSKTTMKLLWHKLKDNYVRLEERMPQLPVGIIKIVNQSMVLDPEKRYPNATEMKNDLVEFYQVHTRQLRKQERS